MPEESKAELYRSYAEACLAVARSVADQSERARWISMAQHWLDWATEAAMQPEKK